MALPQIGDPAPSFALPSEEGELIKLEDFHGKRVVLFFYPRANTKGCTTEACGFRDDYSAFEAKDVVVLGISPDTVSDQAKFSQKYTFPYHLLADEDHAIAEAYGVWVLKKMYGREYMGVQRTTFIIDEEGKIQEVFEKVKPLGHSQQVLDVL